MKVQPTYYPDTKTWETESGVVAETLRGLSKQLPPGVQIVDYYPFDIYPQGTPIDRKAWPDNTEGGKKFRAEIRTNYCGPKHQRRAAQINQEIEQRQAALKEDATAEARALLKATSLPKLRAKKGSRRKEVDADLVLELRSRFRSVEAIALEMECDKTVISRILREAKDDPRTQVNLKQVTRYPNRGGLWSEEKNTTLRHYVAQGLSAGEIGAAMRITRNAVIGRCIRLKLVLSRAGRYRPRNTIET